MKNLTNLLEYQVKDLLDIELQLLQVLPNIIFCVTDKYLLELLHIHLQEATVQRNKIEHVAQELQILHTKQTSEVMTSLVKQTNLFLRKKIKSELKDAGIIAEIQKIEYYKIACYDIALSYAKELKLISITSLLNDTLNQVYEINESLTDLAENHITKKASINF
ncbi:ferritin-like domain-containing protein [Cellulophaga sp. L1A9]|uniref:YciE/YciF ferroxidase family protein n=1 Tax=Cellulophaga sp. L1A9 TaxID=2686362 RepID=UPI00131B9ABB|nr:DUF892 family protein [Cellulophaga sp. L1A9]